jgi:prepilin-type N-terminal cleavage/methylation domain-containing protein
MKYKPNTPNDSRFQRAQGFTLIEMIGVLAVIAILAALLVPKVFSAISDARVNNAAVNCETVKTAIADHYGKYGSLLVDGSATTPAAFAVTDDRAKYFDMLLVKEGLLDKPFSVKIGDGTTNTLVEAVAISSLTSMDGSSTSGFALDGGSANMVQGTTLIRAVITGVAPADAQALSQRIDGPSMSSSTVTGGDLKGRVMYAAPAGSASTTTVYVYLTHR